MIDQSKHKIWLHVIYLTLTKSITFLINICRLQSHVTMLYIMQLLLDFTSSNSDCSWCHVDIEVSESESENAQLIDQATFWNVLLKEELLYIYYKHGCYLIIFFIQCVMHIQKCHCFVSLLEWCSFTDWRASQVICKTTLHELFVFLPLFLYIFITFTQPKSAVCQTLYNNLGAYLTNLHYFMIKIYCLMFE